VALGQRGCYGHFYTGGVAHFTGFATGAVGTFAVGFVAILAIWALRFGFRNLAGGTVLVFGAGNFSVLGAAYAAFGAFALHTTGGVVASSGVRWQGVELGSNGKASNGQEADSEEGGKRLTKSHD